MIRYFNKNNSCIPFKGGYVEKGLVLFNTGKKVEILENGYYNLDGDNIAMCKKPTDQLKRLVWEMGLLGKVVEKTTDYQERKEAENAWLPEGSSFIAANYLTFKGIVFYYINDWYKNGITIPVELALDKSYSKDELINSLKELKDHLQDWSYYQS